MLIFVEIFAKHMECPRSNELKWAQIAASIIGRMCSGGDDVICGGVQFLLQLL